MLRSCLVLILCAGTHAFQAASLRSRVERRQAQPSCAAVDRRSAAQLLGVAAASLAVLSSQPVEANTEAMLAEPTAGFVSGEAARAEFEKKQKAYKKKWRKELANLEYATSESESLEAIITLTRLVASEGNLPEGIRKMDLDQVYKRVQPNLSKDTRLAFGQLDRLVGKVTSVKDLKGLDE